MNRVAKSVLVTLLLLASTITFSIPGDCSAHHLLSEGGPYVSTGGGKIEKFSAVLKVSPEQATLPVWLTFYNGYGGKPGFDWVRVFLNSPGQSGTGGEILIDERTFVSSHVQTVDMTGRLSAQGNQIVIEGAGNAGAIFSWVLTGADSDPSRPSIIKTTGVSSGQSFLIHGTGFGGDTSKIKVMLDDQAAQVMSVDQGIIEAKAPDNLKSTTMISVQVDGKSSNSMPVTIDRVAPYLASLSPLGGPVGTLMTIQGANFSPLARDNIVKVGAQRAEVFKVVDSHTLLFYAPNWGSAWGTLPVTVISGGVPSSNHLEFWCTAHLYGGNPNAAGYAND